ncbi:MAG: DNA primase [Candidatus Saganbacteria bacterium]|nr:DNA primase [Candidatus Saganbacteria bacterium]
MIPREKIEEIRNKADIVDVIGEYVHLKKRGKNYVGLCPFHSEKDPSFTVSPEKQFFHCFGCNEGGNVFAFIMKIENIGFAEAVVELGTKVGIALPKFTPSGPSKPEKEKLFSVMALAQQYFKSCLENKVGEAARNYLLKRNISDKTRDLFGLGFAPPGWDNLFKHLISRGASPPLIERCGLILPREGSSGYYDRFRDRLIFSITDQRGRTIAFGGRSLGNEEPKYLNSSDTPIYRKGETLFSLNLSKEHIKKSKVAVMVEGYFDLITPFQAGVQNIVATLGTALTTSQAKLLARYSETAILAFDADAAGEVATERSFDILKGQGLTVKVAQFREAKDPDEVIRKHGEKAFTKCIASATPFLKFKIKKVLSRHNLSEIEGRSKALKEIALLLSQQKDAFLKQEYAKFCAPLLGTDVETILSQINRNIQYAPARTSRHLHRVTHKPSSKLAEAEKNLIALASQDISLLNSLKKEITPADFMLPETRAIASLLFASNLKEDNVSLSHFLLENLNDESAKKFLSRLLINDHLKASDGQVILADCIKVIKAQNQKSKIASIKLEVAEAEKAGESAKVKQLLSLLKSEISQESLR